MKERYPSSIFLISTNVDANRYCIYVSGPDYKKIERALCGFTLDYDTTTEDFIGPASRFTAHQLITFVWKNIRNARLSRNPNAYLCSKCLHSMIELDKHIRRIYEFSST